MNKSNTVSALALNAHNTSYSLPASEREFLRAKHAADYLSISKSHFHTLVRDGTLPQGKMISGAIRVWRRDMLQQAAQKMWEVC